MLLASRATAGWSRPVDLFVDPERAARIAGSVQVPLVLENRADVVSVSGHLGDGPGPSTFHRS